MLNNGKLKLLTFCGLIIQISYAFAETSYLFDYGLPVNKSSRPSTVTFQQVNNTSSGVNASRVSKVTLRYFTSANCSGNVAGEYTTPDGTFFAINTSVPFILDAESTYQVGATQAGLTMSTINSVAIFLKSTNNNTPQAKFTGTCGTNPSFCCVSLNCSSGTECTSASVIGTQNFELKTTASIGDPADGGLIGCMNGGLNNLVVPAADNSSGITWSRGPAPQPSSATSTTNGATNTQTIVTEYGAATTYAAGLCNAYTTTGGFTSGWFLPAGNNLTASGQLNCLYTNKNLIGGFSSGSYWSSTAANNPNNAYAQNFINGSQITTMKFNNGPVRCARSFIP